ncbi:hypothetical protein M7784_13345 [Desulfovibrio aminophilus]|nr:hypothetical protein [Desulfovibrio aminophilus]MCM0756220.1 hypothetical protein [Desulfovibrio aminophilus]
MKRLVCLVVALYAGLVLASFGMAGDEAKDLVNTVCSDCHSLSRVCDGLGRRDAAAWSLVAARMRGHGASLDAGQQEVVAEYLGGLKPDRAVFCN